MHRENLFEYFELNQPRDSADQELGLLDLSLQNCPADDIYKYFPNLRQDSQVRNPLVDQLLQIRQDFNVALSSVNFLKPPIQYVYNPTEYAQEPHEMYLKKYCTSPKKLLFVGINLGPFGMCQTGVPFGDTNWVKNWLKIQGPVLKPSQECPNRRIYGFECIRKEQSGDRFWKFWSSVCGSPGKFFKNAFVYNYCPLAFMNGDGRNLTPADIKDKELESICDKFYVDVINALKPQIIISIGRYTEKRSKLILKSTNSNIPVIFLPHPSLRSPKNHNWTEKAKRFLEENNLLNFFQ